jgi:hypothetical protein
MQAWTNFLPNNNVAELVLDPNNSGHRGKIWMRNQSGGHLRSPASFQSRSRSR